MSLKNHQLLSLLQMLDTGFPTGAFSHSQGVEAWVQHGGSKSKTLISGLTCILENAGSLGLPFVCASFEGSEDVTRLIQLDQLCHACFSNHVAAKSSRRQGRSLLESSLLVFESSIPESKTNLPCSLPHCHIEVVFGMLLATLGFDLQVALTSFLYSTLKTSVSAAVRLDVLGAIEGQKAEHRLAREIPNIVDRNAWRDVNSAAVKFPVADVLQNTQDTFFCKLFYS